MLEKVRKIWITGFLERSLSYETRILLGLSERPDAVVRPMDLLVQRPDQGERPLPPGTQIVKVFDTMEQLLILGAPGSGKTTLLLELARDLLDRAVRDPTHPIPVVFPLSTWAESRRPLEEWLVEELYQRYDVPRKIGQTWVEADQILPLLDGLDEVKPAHRAACVEAINAFRKAHDLRLVICSRTADYQALAVRLQLYEAIVVQPLSPQQVDSYLTEIGPAGAAVRGAISHDPMLREMLDSPLMLNIVTVAYGGGRDPELQMGGTLEGRRTRLFAAYVDQMFRRRGVNRRYTPQQTVHWLSWLAWQMVQRSQTVFYIERLQPDWLPGEERWAFSLVCRLVVGLVVGLALGSFAGVVFGWQFVEIYGWRYIGRYVGLVVGLALGLGVGLVVELGVGPFSKLISEKITCVETITIIWSWPKKRDLVFNLVVPWVVLAAVLVVLVGVLAAVLVVLVGVLAAVLVCRLVGSPVVGLVVGLGVMLSFGLVFKRLPSLAKLLTRAGNIGHLLHRMLRKLRRAFIFKYKYVIHKCIKSQRGSGGIGILSVLSFAFGEIETRDKPNQGIHRSARNARVGGLALGLSGGLKYGGEACLKHFALRLLLVRSGSIPWNYGDYSNVTGRLGLGPRN